MSTAQRALKYFQSRMQGLEQLRQIQARQAKWVHACTICFTNEPEMSASPSPELHVLPWNSPTPALQAINTGSKEEVKVFPFLLDQRSLQMWH